MLFVARDHEINSTFYTIQTQELLYAPKKNNIFLHTAASIRWSSPTQLLISRSEAYLWLSGREAEFSTVYGRMCENVSYLQL